MLYTHLLRPMLFHLDPERAHDFASHLLASSISRPALCLLSWLGEREEPALHGAMAGIPFRHPIGLAAGFDKNGEMVKGLARLGFAHLELGTVTAQAQTGNERPRLFRLPQDRALINRMGFNNNGAAAMAERLAKIRGRFHGLILGGNIGKTRIVPLEQAHEDYLASASLLSPLVDYLTLNVSSPNTPNLRHLQDKEPLRQLLRALKGASFLAQKPLFLKLAPDLSESQLEDAAEVVAEMNLSGVIATNTTVERGGLRTPATRLQTIGAGGLSGPPLKERSLEVLKSLRRLLPKCCCLISVGGIESGRDVLTRLEAGASAVQVYTGLIYGGPLFAFRLRKELLEAMARKGYRSLAEIAP